jgi:hypothetical protein
MWLQIQMNDNRIDDDSYEIIELNESEPIVFRGDRRKQHHMCTEKNNQVILVVPKEARTGTKATS